MNDNLKKLAEFISAQDEETIKKVTKMEAEELIAYAAENGIAVTAEDIEEAEKAAEDRKTKAKNADGELSDDELDAVPGGGKCICYFAGGGKEDLIKITHHNNTYSGDGGCACVLYGQGDKIDDDKHVGARCSCFLGGGGGFD